MDASPVANAAVRKRFGICITFVVVALSLGGCGGGGGGGNGGTTNPPPPASGSFILGASATSMTIAKNATASATGMLTIAATRTGGFSGVISLQATGLPTGVTASFVPATLDQVSSTSLMTLTVVTATAPGTYNFTIQGTASGQTTQTLSVSLTITAAPAQTGPFTMSISATSYLIYPSNQLTSNPIITITRNAGFTGGVTFTTSGLPATLFIGYSPSTTTGSSTQTLILDAGATPNGTYTATITGSSTQGNQTVTLQIVVASPTVGNIKWKWCSGSTPRYFVAVRDGNGPWTRIRPANDSTYSFNLNSGVGELAEVTNDSGGFRTTVYQMTAAEMTARGAAQCRLVQNVSTRTANGSFGGVTGFRTSQVGMAWWFGSANGNGTFTMLNLPTGPLDVLAARNTEIIDPWAIGVDRFIVRRAQNPASGSTMPVLDFNAAESFAPTTTTWTFNNTNGQAFGVSQLFTTAGGTTLHFNAIPSIDGTPTTRTIYGIPQAQTQAGDLHQVVATVATTAPSPNNPNRALRQIMYYARTVSAPVTLTFPPAMPTPNVSTVAPGRLRAQGTLATEYNTGVAFDITQTTTARFFSIYATRAFLGSGLSTYDVQMPDLSAAIGWDTQFAIRTGIPTNWWVSGGTTLDWFDGRYIFNSTRSQWTGPQTGIIAPADGATYYSARITGNSTP